MCNSILFLAVSVTPFVFMPSAQAAQRGVGTSGDRCTEILRECLQGCKTNDGGCITWCQEFVYPNCTGGKAVGAQGRGNLGAAAGAGNAETLQITPSPP